MKKAQIPFKVKVRLFLIKLGIIKPKLIPLTEAEQALILFCKGHFKSFEKTGEWTSSLMPLFDRIYGWSAKEHYDDYLDCIFNKLLDTFLTIQCDKSGEHRQLKQVFEAAFRRGFQRFHISQIEPIERAIASLCGLIQSTEVIDKYKLPRFELNKEHIIKKYTSNE